jgi:hypothetical protein
MHWILQSNMYHEDAFEKLVATLERMDVPHSIHKVVPFTHELQPEVCVCKCHGPEAAWMHVEACCRGEDTVRVAEKYIMTMGTYTLTNLAKQRGWTPGAFVNENFDYQVQLGHWGERMLNWDAQFSKLRDAQPIEDRFFVRPVTDSKDFAGFVTNATEFEGWKRNVLDLKPEDGATVSGDTRVMLCPQQAIYREWRVWFVDGKAVTASLYKEGSRVRYDDRVDLQVYEFAEGVLTESRWQPARAYCMDVAETPHGLKIIEVNCINSAGWYAADMNKLVGAVEGMKP